MSEMTHPSRRQALRLLAGAPLLPLGASAISLAAALESPAFAAPSPSAKFVSASFTSMPAPSLAEAAAMATTKVGSRLTVTMSDDTTVHYDLSYQPFFITGDQVPDGRGGTILAGGYVNITNTPIVDRSLPGKERQIFSDSPDGTSLLTLPDAAVPGIVCKAVFAVVQFEYTTADQAGHDVYGTLPSPIAVMTLDQNQDTGKLTLVKYHNVDTSKVNGLWITCGASLSPWNTHLSSEEYEPDAPFIASSKQFKSFSANLYGDEARANPYHYGHLPEVTVHPDGTGTVRKHYNLGRISHELVQVMPDNRTVIMGDDATNGGFFMFVADRERDLSAGTLYVAKLDAGLSTDPAAAPTGLSWLKLGHATSDEIERLADTLKPSDIMDCSRSEPEAPGYTKIFHSGVANWVRLKPGMEIAAAFLETHRYAYLIGGSMAFTKMEGTTLNARDKVAYSALQNVVDSMVKGGKGWNPESNIAIDGKLMAGGILAHDLGGNRKDQTGAAIPSDWVPMRTRFLLVGEDIAADALGNLANPDRVSNPDNLKFSETMRTLFIGEDSSTHVNNFLWAYNIDTTALSRLMSLPAGAESTGLHAVDELNGWTYIMSNFQHPGDWIKTLHGKVQPTLDPMIRANYKDRFGAAVGYLTGDRTSIRVRNG